MTKNVVAVWKTIGATPLQCVEKFRSISPEFEGKKISYAGRLDPMAEGVLLLLIGDENKKRKDFEKLKKIYEAEIVWGIQTDTYDVLGKITSILPCKVTEQQVKNAVQQFIGEYDQAFPPYSSKPVRGKPLFWWARNNKIDEIALPTHRIEVGSIILADHRKEPFSAICQIALENINKVQGDFRQEIILSGWKNAFGNNSGGEFFVSKIKVECSSGTYIRRLISDMGIALSYGAVALSIKRIMVGNYTKNDCLNLS